MPLNQIFYGPPGTGKTYHTISEAVKIIDNLSDEEFEKEYSEDNRTKLRKKFNKFKDEGQIAFITFHQSYSYEEFIEGIKPSTKGGNISYNVENGIFKKISNKSATDTRFKDIFLSEKLPQTAIKPQNTIKLDTKELIKEFAEKIKKDRKSGKRVLLSEDITEKDKRIKGKYFTEPEYYSDGYPKAFRLNPTDNAPDGYSLSLEKKRTAKYSNQIINMYDLYNEYTNELDQYRNKLNENRKETILKKLVTKELIGTDYSWYMNLFRLIRKFEEETFEKKELIIKGIPAKEKILVKNNYVLIIDEINRGNISKIFGELITLIEKDKRIGNDEELTTTLPYSGDEFGVPNNLYIIGTMNTADRSISPIDTALRRRFRFKEMMPDYNCDWKSEVIDEIDLKAMLKAINERIIAEYDRDRQIGHSFLMNCESFTDIQEAFEFKILPLLEEYFYDEREKINEVLNKNGFYVKKGEEGETANWELKKEALKNKENYKTIYVDKNSKNSDE